MLIFGMVVRVIVHVKKNVYLSWIVGFPTEPFFIASYYFETLSYKTICKANTSNAVELVHLFLTVFFTLIYMDQIRMTGYVGKRHSASYGSTMAWRCRDAHSAKLERSKPGSPPKRERP